MSQSQARELFMQTDLTKTQIAEILDIPRRTLHYWIRKNNWDRMKQCSAHMPSLIAERCYHIMARFSEQLLSETRITSPITHKEADTLHKLTITISKLKSRSTLNESMEMMGFLMDSVSRKDPKLAEQLMPYIDEYITTRANINVEQFRSPDMDEAGHIPVPEYDHKEAQLDAQDIMEWNLTDQPPFNEDPRFDHITRPTPPPTAPASGAQPAPAQEPAKEPRPQIKQPDILPTPKEMLDYLHRTNRPTYPIPDPLKRVA
jgi:Putative ATPase subunit of terminase (gpP-like)